MNDDEFSSNDKHKHDQGCDENQFVAYWSYIFIFRFSTSANNGFSSFLKQLFVISTNGNR